MVRMKEMQFPVSIRWRGGRTLCADAGEKEALELAEPPEFRSGIAGYWSPEELLVASAAGCFALTLTAVAAHSGAPLIDVTVTGTGHVSRRHDGRFGFTVIELDATLETLPGHEDEVAAAARVAEERCLVRRALDVPVRIDVQVRVIDQGLVGVS
jgi:organic hydroperoxide reductase OsmC/OhrA